VSELVDEHDLGLLSLYLKDKQLLSKFIQSRRQGLSENTVKYYTRCIKPFVCFYPLSSEGINDFLANLNCNNGGKLAYFKAIRAFCYWLARVGILEGNPLKNVYPPKPSKPILPSLTKEQAQYLIDYVDNIRDKTIISLFADSGMRLSELANIRDNDIDWRNNTVTIWGKGNKQRKAPFTKRTAMLIEQLVSQNGIGENIWHMKRRGIQNMLLELAKKTGLPCNPHTFRRTFASNLHRAGLDVEHIMRLGGWESLDMVLRYTRSVKFEDSLRLYQQINL
jgi:integrase/recombinase XerD